MSHPNIPKEAARPWLRGEVLEPDDDPQELDGYEFDSAWVMPGQQEQEQ